MNRDRLMNLPSDGAARSTYALVNTIQEFSPEKQLMAAAILFVMVSDLYGMPIPDLVQAVRNMIRDPKHGEREQFKALRMYVEGELKQ